MQLDFAENVLEPTSCVRSKSRVLRNRYSRMTSNFIGCSCRDIDAPSSSSSAQSILLWININVILLATFPSAESELRLLANVTTSFNNLTLAFDVPDQRLRGSTTYIGHCRYRCGDSCIMETCVHTFASESSSSSSSQKCKSVSKLLSSDRLYFRAALSQAVTLETVGTKSAWTYRALSEQSPKAIS